MRIEFEAWWTSLPGAKSLAKFIAGDYKSLAAQSAWDTWNAARQGCVKNAIRPLSEDDIRIVADTLVDVDIAVVTAIVRTVEKIQKIEAQYDRAD